MPKTKKSVSLINKKPTRKKAVRKKPIKKIGEKIIEPPQETIKDYVVINEYDHEIAYKSKLTWLIVGILGVTLLLFWVGMLRKNISENKSETDFSEISQEISSTLSDVRETFNETKENVQGLNEELTEAGLEQIKDGILQKIQTNLDSENWPTHSSDILGLGLSYPTNWIKNETANKLVVESSTTTSEIISITISDITKTEIEIPEGSKETQTEIDATTAIKYIGQSQENIFWIILVTAGDRKYSIVATFENKERNEIIVEKILATISFIKK